jgi:hypothetical protein
VRVVLFDHDGVAVDLLSLMKLLPMPHVALIAARNRDIQLSSNPA